MDKLIEVKSVSPVAAPRKSRKGASGATEPAAENKDSTAVGMRNDEATASASDCPLTESASMPHQLETTPPQPETMPLQPETTPPQPETMPPQPEATPPQPETTPPQLETMPPRPETTPPEPETTSTGTEVAAQPASSTKHEADSHSLVQAPPRRKRASKFVGRADSPSVQQRHEEEVDTGGVKTPASAESPLGTMEGGSTAGEGVSGPSDSLQPSALNAEVVRNDAKGPARQGGLGGAEEGEGHTLVEAKHPQENGK